MTKKIIRRDTLLDQVYEYLRDQIVSGGIEPGQRLIEEKIAEELGVSRSPVREAIRRLEKDGLVVEQVQGGVTVYNPTMKDYQFLFECRIELEPLAAMYAAERRTEKHIEEMEYILNISTVEVKENNMKKIHELNQRFHQIIVESSENPFLIKMITELRGVISFYRSSILEINPMRKETALRDHYNIFLAIKEQNKEKAKQNMRKHLEADYQLYLG
ncbi:GntR family transcriptional regulator [Bacillus sp. FJAT-49705]|uniref:GntR family transcriptional regulator n=1 Tax=Cytobacillus citreus TaxID=2833586 RepID=A0ABS5NZG5_9BACI|nr:GntR family transcriptional regulator [Cytobacillus citreus]MBS4192981.1 GntR family transcriptional regulator [Cytobacillus citreus]